MKSAAFIPLFRTVMVTVWAVVSLLLIMPCRASVIMNGSFENFTASESLPLGSTGITDWVVIQNGIQHLYTPWPAFDGLYSLDLDGLVGQSGGIAQTFVTVPGTIYRVDFALAGNPVTFEPLIKRMEVSADGQSAIFSHDTTGLSVNNMAWQELSWSFLADDASATLEFRSLTYLDAPGFGQVPGWGPVLDNVSVNAVPEPARGGLLMVAGMSLAFRRRR